MLDNVEFLKEKMVLTCKVLQKQGVLDGYGHLSVRLPGDRILSTPHMPPGKVEPQGKPVAHASAPAGRNPE